MRVWAWFCLFVLLLEAVNISDENRLIESINKK